ncbi:MAG: glycoside hydrolase family 3 C-terminal domain-containing protein, partial [Candidatus Izemoplasmatales bacterium]|nr:glycoside hydrolase family 3 C-terminal domain-containing protein [Candidatus Izemoplasmatales bacterium]
ILTYTNQPSIEVDLLNHHQFASKAYEDCIVLLKNENDILPLSSNHTLGLFGELARQVRYQGGGSSNVQPTKIESLFELMHDVAFCAGYQLTTDGFDQVLIDEAITLAKRVDVAIVVVGLTDQYESEGYDRTHLDLPLGHTRLIEAISEVNPNTIVILQIGSPVVMPWLSKVKAVVNGYLGGQAGHVGMYRILKGQVSPSGRLAETFPMDLTTHPSNRFFAKGNHQVHYQESIYVGYRYYSTKGSEVLFPFGYGLSYSTFEYSNLVVDKHIYSPGNPLEVRLTIKNTGKVEAKEVVMLFIKRPDAPIFGPIRELKQFQKITLAPEESKEVLFIITNQDVCFFHTSIHQWDIFPGKAIIEIMKNANECLLSEEIEVVTKSPLELNSYLSQLSSYQASDLSFTQEDFEHLLGKKLNPAKMTIKRPFLLDHTLEDIQYTFIGKIF